MATAEERMKILRMIRDGKITAEEGAHLLRLLDATSPKDADFSEEQTTSKGQSPNSALEKDALDERIARLRRWWQIPLWIGVGITVIGGLLLFWAYQASGFSFWFGCAWLPFLFGVAVMAIAWSSRTARWLHLRIQQEAGEWPQTINLSFPLPLRFTGWVLRTFGHFIPDLKEQGVDINQVIQAVEEGTNADTPFFIEVDEGEGKEKVQIYIG